MPCPNYQAAISVGTPIQKVNVQQKVCSVMRAVVLIILLLCIQKKGHRQPRQKQQRGFMSNKHYSSRGHHTSHSPYRHCHRSHSSHSHSRTPSHSPSCSPTHGASPRHSSYSKRHSTPHRYYQDSIDVIPADSITTGSQAEGKLFMERASELQMVK